MRQTLESNPVHFFYYNNGVTILARRVTKPLAGGAGNDFATFHCEDISIVNGAQTVGTIGKYGEAGNSSLRDVYLPVRIIVRGDNENFAAEVTKTNNRQNRIENRDFVTLDPEQDRIKTELAIEHINYQLMRSESVKTGQDAFDLVEATTALACASCNIHLAVSMKREISKMWEDISKAPYKELFNATVPGLYVWRCVLVQREIDKALIQLAKKMTTSSNPCFPKAAAVGTHGNRLVAALVFEVLPVKRFKDYAFNMDSVLNGSHIAEAVDNCLSLLILVVSALHCNESPS